MTKTKVYKYIGINGTVTSAVYLPNANPYEFYVLKAAPGKVLTNGKVTINTIVATEKTLDQWYEIDQAADTL